MSNTDQTFRKLRLEEGTQADVCYGYQSEAYYDLDANTIFEDDCHFQSEVVIHQEVNRSVVTVGELSQRRIRELEDIVYQQNREIEQGKVFQRDFEASLTTISKREAENALLRESRERYYNECEFYKLQAAEKTRQCETYEERIREMNLHRLEYMHKIRELEEKVRFLTENYGHDLTERKYPEESRLVRKHEEIKTDSGIGNDRSVSLPKRQRLFRKSLTSLPKCRNCRTVFDKLRPNEITCTFHRASPHPLKAWKSQLNLVDLQLDNINANSYLYWPCCEKYGLKEPPGCLKLKSHEIISPD